MATKIFKAALPLSGAPGEFQAVFATLNVIDLDKDVTLSGAFGRQRVTIEGWGHDQKLPVGKGEIFEDNDQALVWGTFFLNSTAGRDHYETVKLMGPQTQWSYTFNIVDSGRGKFKGEQVRFLKKLDVWGVSPVTRGAGIGTRTLDVKSGLRGSWLPIGSLTVDAVLRQIAELQTPAGMLASIEDELVDVEISELKSRLGKSGIHPSNADLIRAGIVRQYPGCSEQWYDAMTFGGITDMVLQICRAQEAQAGVNVNFALAQEQALFWARQPARRVS
jgi:hypothetical protein